MIKPGPRIRSKPALATGNWDNWWVWVVGPVAGAIIAAVLYWAAFLRDDGKEHTAESSMAKLYASEMAQRVTDHAIQILGGHGYMSEFPVERAWRDARLARIGAGTDEIMKEIIAKTYGL